METTLEKVKGELARQRQENQIAHDKKNEVSVSTHLGKEFAAKHGFISCTLPFILSSAAQNSLLNATRKE